MNSKRRSRIQEMRAGKDLGGRAIPNSGALKIGGGGDFETAKYEHGEAKYTHADAYTLTRADLQKLWVQATTRGKIPVFQIEFLPSRNRFGILFRGNFLDIPKNDGLPIYYVDGLKRSVRLKEAGLLERLKERRLFLIFESSGKQQEIVVEVMHWNDTVAELKADRV